MAIKNDSMDEIDEEEFRKANELDDAFWDIVQRDGWKLRLKRFQTTEEWAVEFHEAHGVPLSWGESFKFARWLEELDEIGLIEIIHDDAPLKVLPGAGAKSEAEFEDFTAEECRRLAEAEYPGQLARYIHDDAYSDGDMIDIYDTLLHWALVDFKGEPPLETKASLDGLFGETGLNDPDCIYAMGRLEKAGWVKFTPLGNNTWKARVGVPHPVFF